MYWNNCSGCNSVTVSKTPPIMVTTFKYDLKRHRKSRAIAPHYICPDCQRNSHSWLLNIANKTVQMTTMVVRKD